MTKTFSWKVDLEGLSGDVKSSVSSVKFGDGYEQRAAIGINEKKQSWSVQKTGNLSDILPVKSFLDDVGGTESFKWTTPFGDQIVVVIDDGYKVSPKGGDVFQLSWTFRQVFE